MTTIIRHDDFLRTLRERFGDDPNDWAFTCPSCGDTATGRDFRVALINNPATRRDGAAVNAADRLGQECIGRTLGALSTTADNWSSRREEGETRGCDWTAYGLLRGPLTVDVQGRKVASFRIAEPPTG